MFKIFLSSEFDNLHKLINPTIGLLGLNFISQSKSSDVRANKLVFNRTKFNLEALNSEYPTMIDAEYLNIKDKNLLHMLSDFHRITGYNKHLGLKCKQLNHSMSNEQLSNILQYCRSSDIQYLSPFLEPNCELLERIIDIVKQYCKPIYADITLYTYKPISFDEIEASIYNIHRLGYDGIIISKNGTLGISKYHELLINILNRINEQ